MGEELPYRSADKARCLFLPNSPKHPKHISLTIFCFLMMEPRFRQIRVENYLRLLSSSTARKKSLEGFFSSKQPTTFRRFMAASRPAAAVAVSILQPTYSETDYASFVAHRHEKKKNLSSSKSQTTRKIRIFRRRNYKKSQINGFQIFFSSSKTTS